MKKILFIILLVFHSLLYSKEITVSVLDSTVDTVFIPIENRNIKHIDKINDYLKKRLSEINHVSLLSNQEVNSLYKDYDPKSYKDYFYIGFLSAEYLIRGSIKKNTKIVKHRHTYSYMKYIIKKEKIVYYTIKLELINLLNGEIVTNYSEKVLSTKYEEVIDEFITLITPYFTPRIIKYTYSDFEKEVEESESDIHKFYTVSFSLLHCFPVSKYSKISSYGIGITSIFSINDFYYQNNNLHFKIDTIVFPKNYETIKSYYTFDLGFGYSYSYIVNDKFSIEPMSFINYRFHFISYTDSPSVNFYYDPFLTVGFIGEYLINGNYTFIGSLSYNLMFENTSIGQFISIETGIQLKL